MSFTGGKLKLKGDDTGVKKKKKKKSKAEDDSKALQLVEETDAQESMPKVNTAYHQLIPGNLVTSTCPPNAECATGLSQHLVPGTLLGTTVPLLLYVSVQMYAPALAGDERGVHPGGSPRYYGQANCC